MRLNPWAWSFSSSNMTLLLFASVSIRSEMAIGLLNRDLLYCRAATTHAINCASLSGLNLANSTNWPRRLDGNDKRRGNSSISEVRKGSDCNSVRCLESRFIPRWYATSWIAAAWTCGETPDTEKVNLPCWSRLITANSFGPLQAIVCVIGNFFSVNDDHIS